MTASGREPADDTSGSAATDIGVVAKVGLGCLAMYGLGYVLTSWLGMDLYRAAWMRFFLSSSQGADLEGRLALLALVPMALVCVAVILVGWRRHRTIEAEGLSLLLAMVGAPAPNQKPRPRPQSEPPFCRQSGRSGPPKAPVCRQKNGLS